MYLMVNDGFAVRKSDVSCVMWVDDNILEFYDANGREISRCVVNYLSPSDAIITVMNALSDFTTPESVML